MRVWLLMLSAIAFVHTAFGQKIDSFASRDAYRDSCHRMFWRQLFLVCQ